MKKRYIKNQKGKKNYEILKLTALEKTIVTFIY